jgi:hypothetical protein
MADMIEPSLDHHIHAIVPAILPAAKKKVPANMLLTITISYQPYGATSLSKDQTSKGCRSTAPGIVDFDQPRSTSKAGHYACTAGAASFLRKQRRW